MKLKLKFMNTKFKILIIFLCWTTIAKTQTTICIPNGSSVNIDGIISNNEWQDADSLFLGTGSQTKVLYKHDNNNLLVAFVGNLQSASRFPEILIDINNDKNSSWQADDWWFHVSAQDCEYQGQYGNYNNCAIVRPNWSAVKNMASGPPSPPYIDTIEVKIPFNTLNINLNSVDSIGLSFMVTNTVNSWIHWPAGADRNLPSTWGAAIFDCVINSLQDHGKSNIEYIKISPNPTDGILQLKFTDKIPTDEFTMYIYDDTGKKVIQKTFNESVVSDIEIDLTGISGGTYLIKIIERNNVIGTKKFILN